MGKLIKKNNSQQAKRRLEMGSCNRGSLVAYKSRTDRPQNAAILQGGQKEAVGAIGFNLNFNWDQKNQKPVFQSLL